MPRALIQQHQRRWGHSKRSHVVQRSTQLLWVLVPQGLCPSIWKARSTVGPWRVSGLTCLFPPCLGYTARGRRDLAAVPSFQQSEHNR